MKNNENNSAMNLEDYENVAVNSSNNAKRFAAGAALFIGGAAVSGGAAYAATLNENQEVMDESPLTTDDIVDGVNVGNEYSPTVQEKPADKVIIVEPDKPEEPDLTWDEDVIVYDENGDVALHAERGTVMGHDFALVDVDDDNKADFLMVDVNDNGQFDRDEIISYDEHDNVSMEHDISHTREIHVINNGNSEPVEPEPHGPEDPHVIYNDFEDEKTGESYDNDFAEDNPDYNPDAEVGVDDEKSELLEEDENYDDEYSEHTEDLPYEEENDSLNSNEDMLDEGDILG